MIRRHRMRVLWVLSALLLASGSGLFGQTAELREEDRDLATRVGERFEVLPLSRGLLLEPRFGDEARTIEIADGRIAVDGRRMDRPSELFERFGDDARILLDLSERSDGELAALFGVAEEADETEPEVVVEREIPVRVGNVEIGRARVSSDAKVVFGGHLEVEKDERTRDVVVIGGSLKVDGEVRGDAAALGGPVQVEGKVTGNVMSFGGDVELGPDAEVEGDVTSIGGEVESASGAWVGGRVSELSVLGPVFDLDRLDRLFDRSSARIWQRPWNHLGRIWSRIWYLMGLALIAFLACLVRLVAPRVVDRIDRTAAAEPWKSAFVGFAAVLLFVPLLVTLVVVLTLSIIGIPLLLLLPFLCLGFVLAAFVGFVGVAQRLGRWAEGRFGLDLGPFAALLGGVGLIYVWSFLGKILGLGGWPVTFFAVMLGIFGWCLQTVVWSVGLGAMILSRLGTATTEASAALPPLPSPSVPSPSAIPEDEEDDEVDLSDLELPRAEPDSGPVGDGPGEPGDDPDDGSGDRSGP